MKIPVASKASAASNKVGESVQSIAARVLNSAGSPADAPQEENVQPNDEVSFDFSVLPGQITFIIEAYSGQNSQGRLLFRGEETESIVAGNNVSITINMQAVSGGIQISPKNPAVTKGGTEQFSITDIDPAQVAWRLKSTPAGFESFIGVIDSDTGLYTAPVAIPYDIAVDRPLGTPVDIQVEAFDPNSNQLHDSTSVRVLSGGAFTFDPRGQVTPPGTGSGSTQSRSSGQRNIAYFEGNAFAVWAQGGQIFFSETVSGTGGLWTNPVALPGFGDGQEGAAIAVGPEGNLYVVYVDCTTCSGFSNIVLLQRKAGEANFTRLPLGESADMTGFSSQNPTVAVSPDGATVYAAWSADAGNNGNDILFQRVDPVRGVKVDEFPVSVAVSGADEEQPTMGAAQDGKVYLAWIARDFRTSAPQPTALMAAVSLNGDGQFEPPVQVNEVPGNFRTFDRRPTLASGLSGTVHIAWEKDICTPSCDGSIYRVAYDKGVLGADGLVFGDDELLGRFFVGADFQFQYQQFSPSIAWDGADGVYIVLQALAFHASDQVNKRAIFLARKANEGDPFSTRAQVDDDIDDPLKTVLKELPSLAMDETGRAFVIWTDVRGGVSPRYIWFAVTEPFEKRKNAFIK